MLAAQTSNKVVTSSVPGPSHGVDRATGLRWWRLRPTCYVVESQTETLGAHSVRLDPDNDWNCDCMGFRYRLGCTHLRVIERVLKEF